MSSLEVSRIDLENGTGHRRHHHHHDRGSSFTGIDVAAGEEDSSYCSEFLSAGGDGDEHSLSGETEIIDSDPEPSGSAGVSPATEEKDCRICHMGLESSRHECGVPMVLGCSCKDELSYVHKHCAETWFKIKGNKTCEICHSIARNLWRANEIDQTNGFEDNAEGAAGISAAAGADNNSEGRRFWRGHRFLNFLLTCMVFAFVISWFFHFNMPSQQ